MLFSVEESNNEKPDNMKPDNGGKGKDEKQEKVNGYYKELAKELQKRQLVPGNKDKAAKRKPSGSKYIN